MKLLYNIYNISDVLTLITSKTTIIIEKIKY